MKNFDHISAIPLLGLFFNAGLRADVLPYESLNNDDPWEDEDFTRLDGTSHFN